MIDGLETWVLSLQERLQEASPAQRPGLVGIIQRYELRIAELRKQLAGCA